MFWKINVTNIRLLHILYARLCVNIVTQKEIVSKWRNFFCLCYAPPLTSAQSFCKGTKSSRKFQ